ncbi:MAG: hypothetical protein GXP25_19800 [Planctomycetes bacterium]|nr:hypothetical protein [Planctomycetota bacterium]
MPIGNEWLERILEQEAPGGRPARLSIVVPSVVAPDEPFSIKLAVLDEKGYPSVECDGCAKPLEGPWQVPDGEVRFGRGKTAVHVLSDAVLLEEGVFRVAFDFDGETFLSNPVRCTKAPSTRIWWGDPHVHTIISRCIWQRCRSLNFCFVCARYVTGLDWVAAADHVSNGRSGPEKWKAQRIAARLFDDPPEFVTLLGYEASLKGGAGGDNNVYFADDAEEFVDEYEEGNTRTLCEKLGNQDFIIVPHHTTRTGKHGELSDDLYLGLKHMPVVEIHSKWGASEYRGNPAALHEIHPGPSYVQDYLARGYAFGFIGGTDTHATMPSGGGDESGHIDRLPGFTAVRSSELTRAEMFSNIRARNCYATSGERIYVEANIAGVGMGCDTVWQDASVPRKIDVEAAGESDIVRVDVVRNGRDIFSAKGGGWQAQVSWVDEENLPGVAYPPGGAFDCPFVYYYIRVTCASGAQAWTSPTWFKLIGG